MGINRESKPTYDYIRGVIGGSGSFTFATNKKRGIKIPAFAISVSKNERRLLEEIKNTLGLKNKIYEYNYQKNDGYKRESKVILIVREFGQLKNIIIPFLYKKLYGNRERQFEEWIERIGNDPMVPESFKFLNKIYKSGFYEKNSKWD